ncbi:hypothetical protein Tco_0267178 [Tanacetum coccineum]
MLLMQAQENGAVLDEEELLSLAGEQGNTFDADVDNQPVQDIALNKDNIFQADECDAFDSDVDDEPTAQIQKYLDTEVKEQMKAVFEKFGSRSGPNETDLRNFLNMHDAFTSAQKHIADLESENFNLRNKIQNDDHDSMIKDLSKLKNKDLKAKSSCPSHLMNAFRTENAQSTALKSDCLPADPQETIALVAYNLACTNQLGTTNCNWNFVKKFIETVRFGNDHFGPIMGYGDYVIDLKLPSESTHASSET